MHKYYIFKLTFLMKIKLMSKKYRHIIIYMI
jgi:hypothetical protein